MTISQQYIKEFNLDLTEEDIGFLVGLVGGDGNLNEKQKSTSIIFGTELALDLAENTLKFIRKLPHKNSYYKGKIYKDLNKNTCRISDYSLYKLLNRYGLTNTLNKQIITPQIKNETFLFKRGFVAGAFTSDGCLRIEKLNKGNKRSITIHQTDQILIKLQNKIKWLKFIQEILKEVNINCSFKIQNKKIGKVYGLNILFPRKSNTAFIFKENFKLHNKAKDDILNEMVKIEKRINLYGRKANKKLTNEQVFFIRNNPQIPHKEFAEKFNMKPRAILNIRKYKTYKELK